MNTIPELEICESNHQLTQSLGIQTSDSFVKYLANSKTSSLIKVSIPQFLPNSILGISIVFSSYVEIISERSIYDYKMVYASKT